MQLSKMEPLNVKLLIFISLVCIGLAATIDRRHKRSTDAANVPPVERGEPPEERPSPGAYDADMILTPEQKEVVDHSGDNGGPNTVAKRKGLANLSKRWPLKMVPYKLKPSAEKYEKKIKEAMKEWERYTCLKFKPANGKVAKKVGHEDHILFDGVENSVGCSSYVGYTATGGQLLNITDECTQNGFGTIIHEIGHAIGYVHEQSRPDRDQYVTIHLENIIPAMQNNFRKMGAGDVMTNDIPYDHSSIMHYGSHYASKNDQTTIEVRHLKDRMDMGQRYGLSRYDLKHANMMYDCPEVNECETLTPCDNGGVCVDEPGTYHCECPEGWRGLNCEIGCQDDHDDCNFFAGSGDCVGGEYQGWMLINCKKSCGICQPYECKDIDENCEWAKSQGYCETEYVDYMQDKCQKTCGFCNYCNPAPCLNGGTCNQFGVGYACVCAEGFSGENCQIPSDQPGEEAPAEEPDLTPTETGPMIMQNLGNGMCVVQCPDSGI